MNTVFKRVNKTEKLGQWLFPSHSLIILSQVYHLTQSFDLAGFNSVNIIIASHVSAQLFVHEQVY